MFNIKEKNIRSEETISYPWILLSSIYERNDLFFLGQADKNHFLTAHTFSLLKRGVTLKFTKVKKIATRGFLFYIHVKAAWDRSG